MGYSTCHKIGTLVTLRDPYHSHIDLQTIILLKVERIFYFLEDCKVSKSMRNNANPPFIFNVVK